MSTPNLFLVGAGKSGTSALYEYLRVHPDIYMPREKELSYFGQDLYFRSRRLSLSEYLKQYDGGKHYRYRGDASVQYLLSVTAATEIKAFSPQARVLIIVRNPLEVIQARHAQNVFAGSETIRDFRSALEAESRRRHGMDIPAHVECINWLYYRDWVRYSEQISRYRDVFGDDRVWLGLFDDLRADPLGVYRQIMRFLDLSDTHPPVFRRINANKAPRSFGFQRAVTGRNTTINRTAKILIPNRKLRVALQDVLIRLNSRRAERPRMDEDLRLRLLSELEPEVRFLETLMHRELSYWLRN